jgi:outer membrane protein assembly factor BamA
MDVTLRVNAGLQYHLKDIRFTGETAFTQIQLRGLFPLQLGDVFDMGKVRGSFDAMRRLYLTKGYVNFTATPEERFDETGRTILLVIAVQEGRAFRFGPLMLSGVEPAPGVGKKVLADWNTYIGKVCDVRELEQFIHEHALLLKIKSADSFWSHVDFKTDEKHGIAEVLLLFPTKVPE